MDSQQGHGRKLQLVVCGCGMVSGLLAFLITGSLRTHRPTDASSLPVALAITHDAPVLKSPVERPPERVQPASQAEGTVQTVAWMLADADEQPASPAGLSVASIKQHWNGKEIVWSIDERTSKVPLHLSVPFTVTIAHQANRSSFRLGLAGQYDGERIGDPDAESKSSEFRFKGLTGPLPADAKLQIFAEPEDDQTDPELLFELPAPIVAISQETPRLTVDRVSNGPFHDPTSLAAHSPLSLFPYTSGGQSRAYIGFTGTARRNENLRIFVLTEGSSLSASSVPVPVLIDSATSTSGYNAHAEIPTADLREAQNFQLMVVTQSGTNARVATNLIPCELVDDPPVIESVTLTPHASNAHADAALGQRADGTYVGRSLDAMQVKITTDNAENADLTGVDVVIQEVGDTVDSAALGKHAAQAAEFLIPLDLPTRAANVPIQLVANLYKGKRQLNAPQETVAIRLLVRPLRATVQHQGFGIRAGANVLTLQFPNDQPLDFLKDTSVFEQLYSGDPNNAGHPGSAKVKLTAQPFSNSPTFLKPTTIQYISNSNTLRIEYDASQLLVGTYQLEVSGLRDIFGNTLVGDEPTFNGLRMTFGDQPGMTAANALPGRVMPGIHGATGNYVAYQEWTPPRDKPDGFNPNDKVETRVARLYFYRDAHRVAQIINRKVKSHNRHGVSATRQLADQSRTVADQLTAARQQAEREAIRLAEETRRLEQQLSDARRNFDRTLSDLQREARSIPPVDPDDPDNAQLDAERQAKQQNIARMDEVVRRFSAEVTRLEGAVDAARQDEANAHEQAQQKESQEQLARQEQFRRELAAAHADPDTYAEGVPSSSDPIEQTSISVIGEGLIHLRGPLKGVNQIRLMIDQIDTPVGQVRVNVHSTQINGDEAEKLELVSSRIQTYIDQARFMSVQTGEMLRKSVATIAGQRAEEARTLYPGASQHERDQRYLYAFFGKDFIDELGAIDSEFLQTGNKLLSLHSMDVTSLSSALMLIALANNGTRHMIMEEFQRQLHEELPIAEQTYLDSGVYIDEDECLLPSRPGDKQGPLQRKFRSLWAKHHGPPPVYTLSQNASFQSLAGFFDTSLQHDETMTPLQREFVRLAQIFKSRLVTELEYKQRVMERALIEDLLGNRTQELLNAQQEQDRANATLKISEQQKSEATQQVVVELTKTQAAIREATNEARESLRWFDVQFREFINDIHKPAQRLEIENFRRSPAMSLPHALTFYGTIVDGVPFQIRKLGNVQGGHDVVLVVDQPELHLKARSGMLSAVNRAIELAKSLADFNAGPSSERVKTIRGNLLIVKEEIIVAPTRRVPQLQFRYDSIEQFSDYYQELKQHAESLIKLQSDLAEQRIELLRQLKNPDSPFDVSFQIWTNYQTQVHAIFENHPEGDEIINRLSRVNQQFDVLLEVDVKTDFLTRQAHNARRPLDHKKFLDMLIDDLEEKYIELLEGTRAHTANIDNYLKRVTTALDDDFNTQFYHPAFRSVRQASQYDDVEFGQTETTNVLANNREFAKVSPSATMEFDLPKRDILIKEGLDSALAIYNDVGALVNDPNLLALAASQTANSPAEVGAGTGGNLSSVRNVLPGLSSETSDAVMAQNAGTRPRYESSVEKLIPDPAIYKFETGTGFEIRPVIQPDGQAVVFDFNYMYTTNVREPVRADEKHLGRVKRHFIDTDVQLSNFELREVSRYVVALKAERTARGVPLLEDLPVVGALWRPVPNREKSLQQNIIMAQATIFPTLFDLMGMRWAPAVADIDPLRLSNREFIVRGRHRFLENRVYDVSSSRVDEFLRVPEAERRSDLYRSQSTIPSQHPNGYRGPGLDYQDSQLREGYQPNRAYPNSQYIPDESSEGSIYAPQRPSVSQPMPVAPYSMEPLDETPRFPDAALEQLPLPIQLPPEGTRN
ncbi:hypothetical protein [Roseimaritima ulvae]|uniref:Uncharacterized protein n=1 Tax=Roseimaritima ulvae TaxID=980254 RepID=A0A5B9QY13_9BACT|nr:hypothetical protein [Roseimaritima ulvae]QEG41986.1 hypothetical protein UC8_40150 [Roseimaritima ulvae]